MIFSFSILLSLPEALCAKLMGDWLELQDLCRLDSAFCQHKARKLLLATFPRASFAALRITSELTEDQSVRFIDWTALRNIKLTSLALSCKSLSIINVVKVLEAGGDNITALAMRTQPSYILATIAFCCRRVESINIELESEKYTIGAYLQSSAGSLRNLSMTKCDFLYTGDLPLLTSLALFNVSDNTLNSILGAARNIVRFTLGHNRAMQETIALHLLKSCAPNMQVLILCKASMYSSIQSLLQFFALTSKLVVVSLQVDNSMWDCIEMIFQNNSNLRALQLSCSCFARIAQRGANLVRLSLSCLHCNMTSCPDLLELTAACKNIIDLTLTDAKVSNPIEFSQVLRQAPQLRYLDIARSVCGTMVFTTIARDLPELIYLGAFNTTCTAGAKGMEALMQSPSLRTIQVNKEDGYFNDLTSRLWQRICPNVKVVGGNLPTPFWREYLPAP